LKWNQGRAAFPKPGWLPLCLDFGDLGKLFLKVKTRFEPTFSSYVGRVGDLDSPTRPTYITATTTITTTLLCCTTVPPCYCVLHLLAVFPFALLPIEPCVAPWACRKPDTARVFPLGGLFFGFSHIPPTSAGHGRKAERSGRSYTHCATFLPNLAQPYSVTRSTLPYLC